MIKENYSERYKSDVITAVYPVEFVVRAFLGTYPGLKMPKDNYQGKRILDLGYGDGRNMPLLRNLGMEIYGVEITDEINQHVQRRMESLGIPAVLKTGTNSSIPFEDKMFDFLLACHACYYVEQGQNFGHNLKEMARVMKPGAIFVASVPFNDTYILKNSIEVEKGHYQITHDPYGIRNGTILRGFKSEEEIKETFSEYFTNFSIGFCDDMFWGIHQKVWTIVCHRNEKDIRR